ncbi:glycosyltransferase [Brevibacterium jeotgali]|uniref:Glycosyl transferases group 1 n=1 Tax=Brevibacterium jeotgali TaxID=1262550 RepID=A0A2H1L8W0_9MICO|nr:glycosyltransferase [Brevibacterium jeotgali]TWB98832.1 glycosyl transferase family 1 [Brevibacterium jeotgali]SMY13190.1 Glycosyl transferases group 1 [Brevibacterium jeotgali]
MSTAHASHGSEELDGGRGGSDRRDGVREFDVLMATDCRFPGGSTASVVEEIEAQHRAGYRTALIHLPSPVQRSRRPFAQRIVEVLRAGKVELVLPHERVRAKVLLVRHPTLFTTVPEDLPDVSVDATVMIANQVPVDDRATEPYYDVETVHRTTQRALGHAPVWAPIGPLVRDAIVASWSQVPMVGADWVNIIDAPVWSSPRDGLVGDLPVLGRHSRGHWSKWPDTRDDLLAAYPDDPRYRVRVLGGTEAPEEILGGLPERWTSLPFGSVPVPRFLAGIDFLVYFHHPGLVEAFGRVVLEGLAAGAVCIVPPQMERVFGDACLYGAPQDVTAIVDRLAADPAALAAQRERGLAAVRERFSYEAHRERLAAFAGAPTGEPATTEAPVGTEEPVGTGGERKTPPAAASALLVVPGDPSQERIAEAVAELRGSLTAPPVVCTQRHDLVVDAPVESGTVDARRVAHLARAHRAGHVIVWDDGTDRRAPGAGAAGTSATGLTSGLGADVDLSVLSRDAGAQWRLRPLVRDRSGSRRGPYAAVRRTAGRVVGGARRHTPQWARPAAQRALHTVGEVRVWGARRAAGAGPVPAVFSHVAPDAPVGLIVVTSEAVDPEATLDAVLAQAQITSRFRPAVLAPRSWAAAASRRGVFLDTMIPVHQWDDHAAVRWTDYLDERLQETVRRTGAAVVTVLERTLVAGDPDPVLSILTATAGRR